MDESCSVKHRNMIITSHCVPSLVTYRCSWRSLCCHRSRAEVPQRREGPVCWPECFRGRLESTGNGAGGASSIRVRYTWSRIVYRTCADCRAPCSSLHSSQKSSFKASLDDKIEANLTAWEKHAQATRSELAEAATMRQRLEDTNSVIQSKVGVHAVDERLKEGWLTACWLCARCAG